MIDGGFDVEVVTRYLPEHSEPDEDRYAFAYQITIRNLGNSPARLLSRYWLITDGDGDQQEVEGAGVVGQQPRILPGKEYRYTSGAIFDTPVGTMEGHYRMERDNGAHFDLPIPRFRLAMPGKLN